MSVEWRSWPKVCQGRSGAANSKRYTSKTIEGTLQPGECWWCEREATKLCDTMLRGRDEAGNLDLYRVDGPKCDASMCDEHATQLSLVLGTGDAGHFHDTLDACPYCAPRVEDRKGRHSDRWRESEYVSASLWKERAHAHATKSKGSAPGWTP